MKEFKIYLAAALLLLVCKAYAQNNNTVKHKAKISESYNARSQIIKFEDYRLFMIYTRDSLIRELLGEHLDAFIIQEDAFGYPIEPPLLNWQFKPDFRDKEINEITTEHKKTCNKCLLKIENSTHFVKPEHLNYRYNRENSQSVNLSIDISKLNRPEKTLDNSKFGLDNKWQQKLRKEDISAMLSQAQKEAYYHWLIVIGLKKANKRTKGMVNQLDKQQMKKFGL